MASKRVAQGMPTQEPEKRVRDAGPSGEAEIMTAEAILAVAAGLDVKELSKLQKGVQELLRVARCSQLPASLRDLKVQLNVFSRSGGTYEEDDGNASVKFTCEVNGVKLNGQVEKSQWEINAGTTTNVRQWLTFGPFTATANSSMAAQHGDGCRGLEYLQEELGIADTQLRELLEWVFNAVWDQGSLHMLQYKIFEAWAERRIGQIDGDDSDTPGDSDNGEQQEEKEEN